MEAINEGREQQEANHHRKDVPPPADALVGQVPGQEGGAGRALSKPAAQQEIVGALTLDWMEHQLFTALHVF